MTTKPALDERRELKKAGPPRAPPAAAPGEVRIIGGQWKRSKLKVLHRPGLRPTPDRVRETLFNWLGPDFSGWRVLDAFAGSGALGFEAASRGAAEVGLLDQDGQVVQTLWAAHARLHAGPHVWVERADALSWMRLQPANCFELIFLDPPFDSGQVVHALACALALLVPDGLLVVESSVLIAPTAPGLQLLKHLRAGAVHVQLFKKNASVAI